MHGAAQQTDQTGKEDGYRKEIVMLKKEMKELKTKGEEHIKQLSVMIEEMRGLREDRVFYRKQLAALREQLTLQRLEQTPTSPTTIPLNPISPPTPNSHSQTQLQIILLTDSNGKFTDEKELFPKSNIKKIWCPNTQKALELLCEEELGSPSHIIIHSGTNDLRAQQERIPTALSGIIGKA